MIYKIARKLERRKRLLYSRLYLLWAQIIYINRLIIGKGISINKGSKIDLRADGNARIGNNVAVNRNCEIRAFDGGHLHIGDQCSFNNNCYIACGEEILIGSDTIFGPNCVVVDHDHDFRAPGGIKDYTYKKGKIVIGKNVWIAANVTILRNTVIGDNSVIGAGCVISEEIPPYTVLKQARNYSQKKYERMVKK